MGRNYETYPNSIIADTSGDKAEVIAGANTGVKGLRVYGGPTDPISDVPVHIDFDHHQIHEGETWRWSVYVASLASGNNKDIQLVVPNITITSSAVLQCPHFRFEVISTDLANAYFYETPTISVAGTNRTPINEERNGSYTAKLAVKEDPTVTAVGTQLWQGLLTASRTSTGAVSGNATEFVLKNNTTYLFRVTSGAAGNRVLIRLIWYEDAGV